MWDMFDIDWWGLALPFAYLVVLSGALMTFSTIYRKRKAAQSANLAPWFGPHLQRNVYLSLLHMEPKDGKIPDSVIRAALMRRAVENIHRIIQIRNAKAACSSLLQRGSVGDDLWQRFQRAEKEMEEEIRDTIMEANALAPNWGNSIFQSANEIAANTMFRKRVDEIQDQVVAEKEWWQKRKAGIQTDFMKELDEEETNKTQAKAVHSEDEPVLVDGNTPSATPSATPSKKKNKGKK
ncbi:pre protein translocase subunit Sec66 [Thozetella sp. PMI_491]|nr:pre protein translocase subunit Sec66 [Thozetella sp. PMI_491]